MKKSIIKKIIRIILTIVQVLILIPPIVLQYFSDRKMGVKRYLVFKKAMFSKETFTPNVMFTVKLVLIFGTTICIFLLAYYALKKVNNFIIKSSIKLIILNIAVIVCMFSKQFEELLSYHFFLIAAFVIIILQYIKAGIRCHWE